MFKPNNHSKWRIGWNLVSEEKQKEATEVLREFYGLEPISIHQVDEWEQASNNFRVETSAGFFLLRKNIWIKESSDLNLVGEVMDCLRSVGVKIPVVARTQKKDIFAARGGNLWQLFPFISGDHYRGDKNELSESAEVVALMCRTFLQLDKSRFGSIKSTSLRFDDATREELRLEFGEEGSKLNALAKDFRFEIENFAKDMLLNFGDEKAFRKSVVHGDIHPHNFLFEDGKLRAILDFGNIAWDYIYADIAYACHRLVRQYVVCEGGPFEETLGVGVRIFTDNFLKICPLTAAEIKFIPVFMQRVLLSKIHLISRRYIWGIFTKDIAKFEIGKCVGLLREVEEFKKIFALF